MAGPRRHARVLAMQALCQWEAQKDESPRALDGFLAAGVITDGPGEWKGVAGELTDAAGEQTHTAGERATAVADYARELVTTYWANRQRVDDRIAAAAANWDLSRISCVERNVMRVAIVEMLGNAVSATVALDEAIEIGREYGGADSPRFVNGVLDLVMKRLERTRKDHD